MPRGVYERHNVTGNRYYTDEQKQWLIENYPKLGKVETAKRFAAEFGIVRKPKSLQRYCTHGLGLSVTEKRSKERYEEMSADVGTISKNCRGEWKIKTEHGWEKLSRYGKDIPKGYVAIHLDRNADNNEPDNIAIVPNGIQTIMRNENIWSENTEVSRTSVEWAMLYKALKENKQ